MSVSNCEEIRANGTVERLKWALSTAYELEAKLEKMAADLMAYGTDEKYWEEKIEYAKRLGNQVDLVKCLTIVLDNIIYGED